MAWAMRDKTCIVGVGESQYTKRGKAARPEFALACEAILKALQDAGIRPAEVDGFVAYAQERSSIAEVAQALGVRELRFANLYPGGGNATCGVVHAASMAVFSETAEVVVCYRSRCQGGVYGRSSEGAYMGVQGAQPVGGPNQFRAPFGIINPVASYALQARRHMHEFGTTSRQFGAISVASYKHAQQNPRAVMYGRPLTIEDHQASRVIADPYRLYDCCQESDGAAAVVVTSTDRARDLRKSPVLISGAAQGMGHGDGDNNMGWPDARWTSAGLVEVARSVYSRAGLRPEDVDVAQFYENFTGQVLAAIEDFGFCNRGEGGPFVEGGRLEWPDGDLPINTSGGNLAEANIHGMEMVVEGARQLRGESTAPVEGAETCLVVAGPAASPSSALILRKS
jgi:acetyl-CoA acetyltransferase